MKVLWFFILLIAYYNSSSAAPVADTNIPLIARPVLKHAAVLQQRTHVYITSDKDRYLSGEALWFNAFVLNAQLLAPSSEDTNLFVCLKNKQTDSIVWKGHFLIEHTHGAGRIIIPDSLPDGQYLLCAYTPHSFFRNQQTVAAVREIAIAHYFDSLKIQDIQDSVMVPEAGRNLQFSLLPEGGQLVAGLENTIAFKAIAADGNPVDISGELWDNGKPLHEIHTDYAGMGQFDLKPIAGHTYQAVVHYSGKDYTFPLPPAMGSGTVLHLEGQSKDSLTFRVAGTPDHSGPYYLRMQCRGRLENVAVVKQIHDSALVKLPTENLLAGITEVTLFDRHLKPVAERLVYIRPQERLFVSMDTLREQYGPKEKVSLQIHTRDADGKPVPALLTARVSDTHFISGRQSCDILSHTQLLSQLRGRVFNPEYYFKDTTAQTLRALDNLLLTQGWRAYQWYTDTLDKIAADSPLLYNRYRARLMKKNGKYNKKPITLMAFNPYNRNKESRILSLTDSTGSFDITPEIHSLGAHYMIKYFAKDNQRLYMLSKTDSDRLFSPRTYLLPNSMAVSDKEENPSTKSNNSSAYYKKEVQITAKDNSRESYLAELDSTDYAQGPGPLHYEGYIIPLNSRMEPKTWVDVEVHAKPIRDKNRVRNGNRTISTENTFGTLKIIIAPVEDTTKPTDTTLFDKFNLIELNGYSANRVFYSPDYDKEDTANQDARNTLYWNPEIITDTNGNAVLSFFTSDIRGHFDVTVEGISANGLMGSGKSGFFVRKENIPQR